MNTRTANEKATFTLVHEFNAPKELVFNAFSNAEALNEWWGPADTPTSAIKLDFRPGGIFHYKMEFRDGTKYGRFLFSKIEPYYLLEFTNAFADEQANVVRAPFDIPLPLEILYRLVFSEHEGKTAITLSAQPVNANAEEVAGFQSISADMKQGFGATFDQLTAYLNK